MEPAGVEAKDDGRERLENPDATEQLEVDGIRGWQQNDEEQRARLHEQRDQLGGCGFLAVRGVGAEILFVDVAREEIGRCNGHDRGWHQRTDGDGRETEALEPAREYLDKEAWHRPLRAKRLVRFDASHQRHEAEERNQAEDK